MKKMSKLLTWVLVLAFCCSCELILAKAATTISYSPNPKVEYSYSSSVTTGTIRYISQISGSTYFNSNYWGNWASQAGIECGTASISMALSYVGINKTPKQILDAHNGTTYFTGWGPSTSNPSVSTGMSNYINGKGKYSPPIVHFTTGYSSGTHYVLLIGKVSSSSYIVLDPASNSTWTLSTSDSKYKSIDQVFQYYNINASIPSSEPTTILYPTSGSIVKIASGVGNNMYLDFACSSDNVQIYENCDGHSNTDFVKSQYFKLTHVGDGWYTITNPANGKAADVDNWTPDPETNVHQYDLHNGDNQLFRFYDAGNGYCYIKSKLGCYVDVKWGDSVNNTNVWMYTFNGNNSQKWKIQSHSHSYTSKVTTAATCSKTGVKTYTCYCGVSYTETIAKIAHSYTSKVTKAATCSATGVRTYTCSKCSYSYTETIAKTGHKNTNDDNKCDVCGYVITSEPTTILYPTNNAVFKISTALDSNKVLDCEASSDNIRIYENQENNPGQYYKLTHIGDGWYTITNTGNGKVLDVEGEKSVSGTNVSVYEFHNGSNQMFRFYDAGNGYYFIKSKLGFYLDVNGAHSNNNTNVQIFTFNGRNSQKWKLVNHSHSYNTEMTEATLVANGKTETICSVCGDVKSSTEIAKVASVTLSKENYVYDGKNKTPKVTVKDADGNTLVKNTDYKLSVASKRSGIGRYTVKVTFIGNYSGTKSVYFYIKTGKPSSVKSASQTTSSVKLSWSAVPGASGYTVYRYSPSKKAYVKAGTTEGTSYTVKSLYAGTKYTFRVVSYGKTTAGKVYDSDSYALLKTATKTKTPTLSKVTASSTKGKATLTHTNVSGETGYTVYYSTKKDSGFKKYANFKADTTTCNITGLTSGKTYYFKVRTYITTDSGYVYSAWSEVKSVKVK